MYSVPRARDPALPRRRQNKSCDQCREGKRRCDVQVYAHTSISLQSNKRKYLGPCSNCVRWKKQCTTKWIQEKRESSRAKPQPQGTAYSTLVDDNYSNYPTASTFWHPNDTNFQLDGFLSLQNPSSGHFDFPDVGLQLNSSFGSSVSYASCPDLAEDAACQPFGQDMRLISPVANGPIACSESLRQESQNDGTVDDLDAHLSILDDLHDQSFESDTVLEKGRSQLTKHPKNRRDTGCHAARGIESIFDSRAPSPLTAQLLAEDYNRLTVKKGLMKIYHDSMEGALSCWLTERNCPYSSATFDGRDVWSSDWANRIVTRICDLDKAYASTGALSKRDQQQASKVLNLVVMAFAAQWSQTGERGNSRLPNSPISQWSRQTSASECGGSPGLHPAEDDIFGRDMQKSLWHQANKALCEASDNASFRVIFAGIIFSLAQRPIDSAQVLREHNTGQRDDLVSLFSILDLDGAPIWLDVALRKLHDHQRTLEDAKTAAADGRPRIQAAQNLSRDHKETIGLLFWLAIMFDTLSAAVNRRSFTISDKDSNFNGVDPPNPATGRLDDNNSMDPLDPVSGLLDDDLAFDLDGWCDFSDAANSEHNPKVDIWGSYFLDEMSRAGNIRSQHVRWPCSYDEAAACLTDAAPVKVLLFRRVARLQSLSYRRSSADEIEKTLDAVMEVYNHWNQTYGRFIHDCVNNHEDLPARIQSWYILLAGHWNLAVLILSDTVQKLDDTHQTMPYSRHSRQSTDFIQTLRTRAAYEVSELGRNSRYGPDDLTFSKSPDFHHAVNKAALLTEPWTMVLVQSFGHAGAFLVRQILSQSEFTLPENAGGFTEARKRLQYCIDALWLLGKKSDMAMCAAQVLQQAVG